MIRSSFAAFHAVLGVIGATAIDAHQGFIAPFFGY